MGVVDVNVIVCYVNYNELEVCGIILGSNVNCFVYFCFGCLYNISIKLFEGFKVMGGIGCYGLVVVVMDWDIM